MTPLELLGAALVIAVTAALLVIYGIIGINALTFPRLRAPRAPLNWAPKVSICIPARNEAAVIAATINTLMHQTYRNYEIVLLDDNSQDGTAEIAQQAAIAVARERGSVDEEDRLRIIKGLPLPDGWLGKTWACHQLSNHAQGEIFLFTDADVRWTLDGLAAILALLDRERADLLTVWSTQETVTWGERLVVPLMALVILGYLPAPLVHRTRSAALAAANGQCMVFRKRAYTEIGGHLAVRGAIVEDIQLARLIKRRGFRLRMAEGADIIACRMYTSWAEVRDGYAKNIIAGYGGVPGLVLGTLFHWAVFLFPALWLLVGWAAPGWPLGWGIWPGWALGAALAGIGARLLTAALTGQRKRDAWLLPVSVLLMTAIAGRALYWQVRYGGPRWKGRTIRTRTLSQR